MSGWIDIGRMSHAVPQADFATSRLQWKIQMKIVEPPSCSSLSNIVFVGRNSRGQWVAQEQNGLCGGLFVNRTQAINFALVENGHHPETIVELRREIELDLGDQRVASERPQIADTRRVA
jgi:hypothetical protein